MFKKVSQQDIQYGKHRRRTDISPTQPCAGQGRLLPNGTLKMLASRERSVGSAASWRGWDRAGVMMPFSTSCLSDFSRIQNVEHDIGRAAGDKQDAIHDHREGSKRAMSLRPIRPNTLDAHLK